MTAVRYTSEVSPDYSVRLVRHPADVWLVIKALFWLLSVTIMLRWSSLSSLLKRMDRKGAVVSSNPQIPLELPQLARYLDGWLRRSRVQQRPCLYRSLVLFAYLRRKGLPVQFYLGVYTGLNPWKGHAWLECLGMAIDDATTVNEIPLQTTFSYPAVSGLKESSKNTENL